MSKPIIFISHIHEEKEFVNELNTLLSSAFKNDSNHVLIDIYQSSSGSSQPKDGDFLNKIKEQFTSEDFRILIVVFSPESVNRKWINFEIGCAWLKKQLAQDSKSIMILPVLHSGIERSRIPYDLALNRLSFYFK